MATSANDRLRELVTERKRLRDAATQGEWQTALCDTDYGDFGKERTADVVAIHGDIGSTCVCDCGDSELQGPNENAAYIAHAANTDAELAELVEAVLRENERLKHMLACDSCCGECSSPGRPATCICTDSYTDEHGTIRGQRTGFRRLLRRKEAELAALRARCEGLEAATGQGIACPFCGEQGFDTEGLKRHFSGGMFYDGCAQAK